MSHLLRALWGLDVAVSALPPSRLRSTFEAGRVALPAGPLPRDQELAALAHVGAHLCFGSARFARGQLKPLQVVLISLLEDARVERLASARYPGLGALWGAFHVAAPEGGPASCSALLARLARALHDDAYVDPDAWVGKARQLFWARPLAKHDAGSLRALGGALGNDLGQMRLQLDAREYLVEPAYRDDHAGLWEQPPEEARGDALEAQGAQATPASPNAESTFAEEIARYPEWDYVIGRERADFCTVRDRKATAVERAIPVPGSLAERARVRRAAQRLGAPRRVHLRRLPDGDRLDLPALVTAQVARAAGHDSKLRVYRATRTRADPPALLVLLDLSESLNEQAPGTLGSRLELARHAAQLLAESLAEGAVDWAIHGFSSNGRHEVDYTRFKDFDESHDDASRARLSSMRARFSTRLGAAIRHASHTLSARPRATRLLVVVSDGEPSDVDIHDEKYLVFDARQAVVGANERGITSVCLGLAASHERTVQRVFGHGRYVLLDQPSALPRALSQLCTRLCA